MKPKCVNLKCESRPTTKLVQAQKSICIYYNVPFRLYQKVCGKCLKQCTQAMYSQQMIERRRERKSKFHHEFSTITSYCNVVSDEDNVKSTLRENSKYKQLLNCVKTIYQNIELKKSLKDEQQTLSLNALTTQKSTLIAKSNELIALVDDIKENSESLQNIIFYKYDNLQKFKFQVKDIIDIDVKVNNENNREEIHIIDISKELESSPLGNNTGVLHEELSKLLPSERVPRRRLLRPGDMVYALKLSLLQPWSEATIEYAISNIYFQVAFCKDGEKTDLNYIHINYLAYSELNRIEYPIGTRVIAKFNKENIKMTNNFYAGVIAEPPIHYNNYRYLIFFDDGSTQYVLDKNIRLVCHQSTDVIDDVNGNVRQFIKAYLDKYPVLPMVQLFIDQSVQVKINNKWCLSKVIDLDASLAKLKIDDLSCSHIEWIYRGSNRLKPIKNYFKKNSKLYTLAYVNKMFNKPYVELGYLTENKINIHKNHYNMISTNDKSESSEVTIELMHIPLDSPKPIPYVMHKCNHFCRLWTDYDAIKTKYINALSIPLHLGFKRLEILKKNSKIKSIMYRTPCGLSILNEDDMYNYLKITSYVDDPITIDLFSFDCSVNPLNVIKVNRYLKFIPDISNNKEFKPISAVNNLDDSIPPDMIYTTKNIPKSGVNMNLDLNFVCSCDCTDNCDDKTKCSCWQLTCESQKKLPDTFKNLNIGYRYKRLHEQLLTGIYECNKNCKCLKSCSNRVVQEPISTSLQLFFSEKKGWGIRTLADIPKGAFVCKLVGEIYMENNVGINGDENNYLANLDFIETNEKYKSDYESDVEYSSETENKSNDSEEEEYKPNFSLKKSTDFVGKKKSLRLKNIQNTNTKTHGKHQLSKLNMQKLVDTQRKSLRYFLDPDCSIYILDAKIKGNIGRYVNHSCDPNMFIQNVFINSHDPRFPTLAYFASKNISAGTELCFDYQYEIGSEKGKIILCYCRSKNCKGRLL